MIDLLRNPRRAALLETAAICVAVEVLVLFLLAVVLNGSLLAAAFVSVGFFGPLSIWLAPFAYRRLLKTVN